MIRKAFVMSVNRGCEEEYIKRHNPITAELEEVLKEHGVSNYSIYLDRETGTLFGYVEIVSLELWDEIASTAACQSWWKFMRDVMPANSDNSPVASELEEVFYLK